MIYFGLPEVLKLFSTKQAKQKKIIFKVGGNNYGRKRTPELDFYRSR